MESISAETSGGELSSRRRHDVYSTDAALLERVLKPYKPACRYVHSAVTTADPHAPDGDRVVVRCELSIPESCYIDDTGHFNSVEFNICYNQMVYYAIAMSIQEQLLPAFRGWTMQHFWDKQLPDILITRFESSFRKPVNARRFVGEVELSKGRGGSAGRSNGLMLMRTRCEFRDDAGGHCNGLIQLAFLNPPLVS